MENPNFLDKKYSDLTGSKPVERAVRKARQDPERKAAPHSREERIQAYLDRLDKIVDSERGWELLKSKIIKEFVIDTEDEDTLTKIAHGLFESEKRLAVEQGRGAEVGQLERQDQREITDRYKGLVHEKREVQERTLGSWLDYLEKNDAEYPIWFRYFVVRNLEKMGTLDKEKGEYSKRTDFTIAPFPELNSEALGFVYRMLTTGIGHQEFTDEPEKREELAKLVAKKDFIKLYTFAQIETAGSLNRESLRGEWVRYPQGSDHHVLENSLRGKGTGWCTAEGSAYAHIQGGDFYVYYTLGKGGKYSEPRIAIRMEGDQVAEVRGVNHRQELEPALVDIASSQYRVLPGGDKFDKKSADMKKVTELARKEEKGEPFTKDDLIFIYEINGTIEGFGYDRDPRVDELRKRRNPREDMPIVFECTPQEIAHSPREINQNIKAYVGPLEPGIFQKLPDNFEHIYTSFPDKKIRREDVEIGGKSAKELEREMENAGMKISDYARDMLRSKDFVPGKNRENATLIRLTVADLGFNSYATTDQIYRRAEELGLELCPPDAGPNYRLKYKDQPMNEWIYMGMKQLAGRYGDPNVFGLARSGGGLWLYDNFAHPDYKWNPDYKFVFRLRKAEPQKLSSFRNFLKL